MFRIHQTLSITPVYDEIISVFSASINLLTRSLFYFIILLQGCFL